MHRLLLSLLLLFTITSLGHAQSNPYHYGEAWWLEPRPDGTTSFLLQFGKPAVSVDEQVKKVAVKKPDNTIEDLLDLKKKPDPSLRPPNPNEQTFVPKPVDESKLPPTALQDYGFNRTVYTIDPKSGCQITPAGRFGAGLECDGGTGVLLNDVPYALPQGVVGAGGGGGSSIDLWFKVDRYPNTPACICELIAAAGTKPPREEAPGGRLLLHPDGRVQMVLRHPHGQPRKQQWTEAQYKAILAGTGTKLISRDPVPQREWVHVYCQNDWPIVQGPGQPFGLVFHLNGERHASYVSERWNEYNFLGHGHARIRLGNNLEGTQPFVGTIDAFRLCNGKKDFYPRPPTPWRDATLERKPRFDKPYFLTDSTVFHASLDRGLRYDFHRAGQSKEDDITFADPSGKLIEVEGIRGKGIAIDPRMSLPRFSLRGMSAVSGSLEFSLRPDNFDNFSGGMYQLPTHPFLSAMRLYGRDKKDGQIKKFLEFAVPRGRVKTATPPNFHPGAWNHYVIVYTDNWSLIWRNQQNAGSCWLAPKDVRERLEPLYAEFGVTDDITVKNGERPRIAIDEVVGYTSLLHTREVAQAMERWRRDLEPIVLYDLEVAYFASKGMLGFYMSTIFPEENRPEKITVEVFDAAGKRVYGPFERAIDQNNRFDINITPGKELPVPFAIRPARDHSETIPFGEYEVRYEITTRTGEKVSGVRKWKHAKEWWVGSTAGTTLKTPPNPWVPITVEGNTVSTRMTRHVIGDNGLPVEIHADGVNLLARPTELLENGKPMNVLRQRKVEQASAMEVVWSSRLGGKTCEVELLCRCEYDGMIRHELRVEPRPGQHVGTLTLNYPIKPEQATQGMVQYIGQRGMGTLPIGKGEKTPNQVWTSKDQVLGWLTYQARQQKKQPPTREEIDVHSFCPVVDVSDRNRGLYWFADTTHGWGHSKKIPSQSIEHHGSEVWMTCNLIAEPLPAGEAKTVCKDPIVFGLLPHPARPLPQFHRTLERSSLEKAPKLTRVYMNVFMPWPKSPKAGDMAVYPAADPDAPERGPSFEYAERCAENLKISETAGLRMFYMSKYWIAARTGAQDGWEWRGGPSHEATLTPRFVEYLAAEMNEFVRRDIHEGIYIDDTIGTPSKNVGARQAVKLSDGGVIQGEQCWATREMFKRYRQIFHEHGKEPMILSHITRGLPYHAVVFCDSYLDGEGHPTITAGTGSFIDHYDLKRAEMLDNGPLWGVTPFFMVSIWEGGLAKGKQYNPHPRWAWRMARSAMSLLAHFENGVVYTDQGNHVYRHYEADLIKWGTQDPAVKFVPYWHATDAKSSPDSLVSYYQDKERILLIVSNRQKDERDIDVSLDLVKLGLSASAKARDWDTGWTPIQGTDVMPAGVKLEPPPMIDEVKPKTLVDELLKEDDPKPLEREAITAPPVEWKDGVLRVKIRGHDFRMLTIE